MTDLLQDLDAVYNMIHDKRGEHQFIDEEWCAYDWCMGELRPLIQHHKLERNKQLAEAVKEKEMKPVFYAVFADYSDGAYSGMGGCVCLTADWKAAYYAYHAVYDSNTDKNLSMWQLEEGKWEVLDMEDLTL